jgi:hypothetical protein
MRIMSVITSACTNLYHSSNLPALLSTRTDLFRSLFIPCYFKIFEIKHKMT